MNVRRKPHRGRPVRSLGRPSPHCDLLKLREDLLLRGEEEALVRVGGAARHSRSGYVELIRELPNDCDKTAKLGNAVQLARTDQRGGVVAPLSLVRPGDKK